MSPTLCCKLVIRKFSPFDVVDALDHCDLVVVHLLLAVVVCDVCACVSPVSLNAVVEVVVVVLVLGVDEEPEGTGATFCTPLVCSVVLRDVAIAGDAAAVHAAAEAKSGNLREEDVAVAVVAAAAVVAAVATAYLEVLDHAGCDVEAEAKVGTARPGGK